MRLCIWFTGVGSSLSCKTLLLTDLLVIQIKNVIYVDMTLKTYSIIVRFVSSTWIWFVRFKLLHRVSLSNMKVHEHTLTLIARLISFVCDACGMEGDRSPYACLQCDLMFFHQDCACFPRVIHVNRHDNRVSYTYPLGAGEWKCGVCWKEIDWSYGANYSCSDCSDYAIHSLCATRDDVWDGEELDGVPEEVEDII
ncbi:unnamed protein product [Microthlaspi erraticum]|uniref:DC1 domain-containing protein n=1 Tax=Microthlaspi erraticum TaxID=1685480 RepID=A0A6D2K017_9BRAS|nr:unnamed protein product [Microthlaspi erraticum]